MVEPEVFDKHDAEDWHGSHVNCDNLQKVSKLVDWDVRALDKF